MLHIIFGEFARLREQAKLDSAHAQIVIEPRQYAWQHVKDRPRILPRQLFDDGQHDPFGHRYAASDAELAGSRIAQMLDLTHSLPQLAEGREPAMEQRAAVLGRFDALRTTVEQPRADRRFQICDRSRNG